MGGFLSTLGQRLAERWFTLLVLPGALYLAVTLAGLVLGQADALDVSRLTRQITAWSKEPVATSAGGQITLLVAILAGSAAVGLVAQAIGRAIESLTLAADWITWPQPLLRLAGRRVEARQARWDEAHTLYVEAADRALAVRATGVRADRAERDRAYAAMVSIAEACPERPTWAGDRIHSVVLRLGDDLGIDLSRVWPAMWLTLPDTVRAEITAARTGLSNSATLAGWALLYAPLIAWWWPAAVIAVALLATARSRFRSATEEYALVLEAAARVQAVALAQQLALPSAGPFNREAGAELSKYFTSSTRKR